MIRAAALLALALLAAPALLAQSAAERERREAETSAKLLQLKERVAELAAGQKQTEAKRSAAASKLREADGAVAAARREADEKTKELADAEAELAVREVERTELAVTLDAQRGRLAALVRAAYAHGRHEQLKLLLAQDQVGRMQRVLAYQRHVQQARASQVQGLLAELDALAAATRKVAGRRAALDAARVASTAALAALDEQREAQRQSLAALDAAFQTGSERLAAFGRDAEALEQLLTQLRDAISDVPQRLEDDRPFASRRGQLPLPIDGQVQQRFGSPTAGGSTSEGVRFAAARGTPVRAVGPGRVVYADWLKGHGLLVILDHGGGWMTLYAHSEVLDRGVGDWVAGGDVLARAGSSGGEPAPGLYFELRRSGQPVDPRGWWR